jgi:hypothetical protein
MRWASKTDYAEKQIAFKHKTGACSEMPDWKRNGIRWVIIKASFIVSMMSILPMSCLADVLNFHNGKVVHGKLERLTGDIIEFKEAGPFGNRMHVARLKLTNRHDIVAVHGFKRYFGEILYLDRFKLELKTATGLVSLNRLKLSNIILGSPAEQPVSNTDIMHMAPGANNPKASGGSTRIQVSEDDEPLPGTDDGTEAENWSTQDSIPAVNH